MGSEALRSASNLYIWRKLRSTSNMFRSLKLLKVLISLETLGNEHLVAKNQPGWSARGSHQCRGLWLYCPASRRWTYIRVRNLRRLWNKSLKTIKTFKTFKPYHDSRILSFESCSKCFESCSKCFESCSKCFELVAWYTRQIRSAPKCFGSHH